MSKNSLASKTFAAFFGFMTVAVTGSMIGMIIYYNMRLEILKPTRPPTPPSTTLAPPPDMRLRGDVLPELYRIFIKVYFYSEIPEERINVTTPNQTLYFDGNVTINLKCVEKTKTIFLHSRNQNVSQPVVMNLDSGDPLQVEDYNFHSDQSDFLEIVLAKPLEVGGNYSLSLAFSADVNEYLDGLFLSTYSTGESKSEQDKRFLVATNMEPTSARTVFPCFDEPAMKAHFQLTVIHREGTTALANAPAPSSDIRDGWKHTEFERTNYKMSTYLFAFTVSEFTGKKSPHEKTIHTYARPEATDAGHADYAASITGKIIDFYQKYFDIAYSQKLDQIALPDLGPAAMENWGLVTYQEGLLLYEDGVSSELHKEVIASLISHELAHQWFGNLVTMNWWNELWLNEGFATYMSSLAVEKVEPSFKVRELTIAHELHTAFEADSLASSHPLTPPAAEVETTDEILGLFDPITYNKGSSVLRMLMDLLGESVFQKGIQNYLKDFKERTTSQKDLWEAMRMANTNNNEDVEGIMNTWTNQNGFPVITINTTSGYVQQKQFLFNSTSVSNALWKIPIRAKSASGETFLVRLEKKSVTEEKFKSEKGEWILANVNCPGFYRVNYDLANWARLLNELETHPQRIPLLNRGQLIDDAFNLARAKQVSVSLALNSTRFLYNETDYIPWESAIRNLQYFVLMFDRSEVYGPMRVYLRNQVTGLYNFFHNDRDNETSLPEDHSLQYNQINAIKVACSNGLPDCLDMVKDKFHFWMTNGTNEIHPNLRSVIYCQAIAAGGQEEWEFAWKQFENSTDISEQDRLLEAMTCTKKIWLLNRYLEYTLDPTKIRLMDVSTVISYIAQNEAGHALAWNFLRANWDYVSQLHGAYLIQEVTSRFSTPFELEELEYFAIKYDLGPAARAVENAIEQTKVNIQWVDEHKDTVLDWFLAETR